MSESASRIKVLLVEDNLLTRLGIASLLETQDDIEVVGQADSGVRAVALYQQTRPDAVVCDLRMPGFDGVQTIAALRRETPPARVLVLTAFEGDEDVFRALQAGALGYLTKESRGAEILEALRAVATGQRRIPPHLAARVADHATQPSLTGRERDVLGLIFKGHSNREIAAEMGLAEKTIEMYVSNLLGKLGAKSRTEAVSIALGRGLLPR